MAFFAKLIKSEYISTSDSVVSLGVMLRLVSFGRRSLSSSAAWARPVRSVGTQAQELSVLHGRVDTHSAEYIVRVPCPVLNEIALCISFWLNSPLPSLTWTLFFLCSFVIIKFLGKQECHGGLGSRSS